MSNSESDIIFFPLSPCLTCVYLLTGFFPGNKMSSLQKSLCYLIYKHEHRVLIKVNFICDIVKPAFIDLLVTW